MGGHNHQSMEDLFGSTLQGEGGALVPTLPWVHPSIGSNLQQPQGCWQAVRGGIRFERSGSGWIRQLLRFDALASHPVLGQTEERAAESAVRSQRNPHAGVVGQDWTRDQ